MEWSTLMMGVKRRQELLYLFVELNGLSTKRTKSETKFKLNIRDTLYAYVCYCEMNMEENESDDANAQIKFY